MNLINLFVQQSRKHGHAADQAAHQVPKRATGSQAVGELAPEPEKPKQGDHCREAAIKHDLAGRDVISGKLDAKRHSRECQDRRHFQPLAQDRAVAVLSSNFHVSRQPMSNGYRARQPAKSGLKNGFSCAQPGCDAVTRLFHGAKG